eukprot:1278732-Rhodomonas_salina.2
MASWASRIADIATRTGAAPVAWQGERRQCRGHSGHVTWMEGPGQTPAVDLQVPGPGGERRPD